MKPTRETHNQYFREYNAKKRPGYTDSDITVDYNGRHVLLIKIINEDKEIEWKNFGRFLTKEDAELKLIEYNESHKPKRKNTPVTSTNTQYLGITIVNDKFKVTMCTYKKSIHLGNFSKLSDGIKAWNDCAIINGKMIQKLEGEDIVLEKNSKPKKVKSERVIVTRARVVTDEVLAERIYLQNKYQPIVDEYKGITIVLNDFRVNLCTNGKSYYLGTFAKLSEAITAWNNGCKIYGRLDTQSLTTEDIILPQNYVARTLYKGISKYENKFKTIISYEGKSIYLGMSKTLEEAVEKYNSVCEQYGKQKYII